MGGLLAGLGVLVLVIALIALIGPHRNATSAGTRTVTQSVGPTAAASTPRSTARSAPSSPPSTRTSSHPGLAGGLPLKVLNDTSTPNLATQAGDQFKARGWTVTSVDENYQNNILSTAAYYDPSVPKARAVAQLLQRQFPAIKRVAPKFAGLVSGPIVVVLTTDYSSG